MDSTDYLPFLTGIILGALIGGLTAYFLIQISSENLIQQYYDMENAVSVSPFDYVREMESGNLSEVLVDLRNKEDYDAAHFNGSVNVPAEQINATELISSFDKLPKDKTAVVFCYSSYCMLGRKTGKGFYEYK